MDFSVALEAAPKALVYASVMLCVGAVVGRGLLRFRVAALLMTGQGSGMDDAFRRLTVSASLVLVGALALRAWAHTAVVFSLTDSLSLQNLHTITLESRWGAAWRLQIAAAFTMTAIAVSISRWPLPGWPAAGGGALVLCYLVPMLGHAAGETGGVVLHGTHILAAGIWMGTLTAMAIAARGSDPAQTALAAPPLPLRQAMLSQFSPVAFTGSGLLLITGATAAWWYLGGLLNLVRTGYGRVLVLKLVLVAAAAACGFINWRALRRPATSIESRRARRLLVGLEVAFALSVVVVTAFLTEIEHP